MVKPFWRKRRKKRHSSPRKPALEVEQILKWADAYHARMGTWPKRDSGVIPETLDDTWFRVDKALNAGRRGLPGGSSLARLLEAMRGVRNIANLPALTVKEILQWADACLERSGAWPHRDSADPAAPGETWRNVDAALRQGLRGLRADSSLPRLLARHRLVNNVADRPPLSEEQIFRWARQHQRRTGDWPTRSSGAVPRSQGDTWPAIDAALHKGTRGLPGGSSLAQLLARHGVNNQASRPPLTEELILTWADAHHRRTGRWPRARPEPVVDAPGETWNAITKALRYGHRTLPGGLSLAALLVRRRGLRNNWHLPKLTVEQILSWADAYQRRHGCWPTGGSGPVREAPAETWKSLDAVLRRGRRGLAGGSSLHQLLVARRGMKARKTE